MRGSAALLAVLILALSAVLVPQGPAERGTGGRADEDRMVWINPTPTGSSFYASAWGEGDTGALLVGQGGTVVRYSPLLQDRFRTLSSGTSEDLHAVAAHPGLPRYLVAGASGALLLFEGSSLLSIDSGTSARLRAAAWSPDGSSALVAGDDGTLLVYEGGAARALESGTTMDLRAVAWAPDGDCALVAGERGYACSFNGTACAPLETGTEQTITALAWRPDGSSALAVGSGGAVLSYDGRAFSAIGSAGGQSFHAAAWRQDGAAALIVGQDGTSLASSIYMLDGSGLHAVESGLPYALRAVVWEPGTQIALLAGSRGLVAEYSSAGFETLSSPLRSDMSCAAWRRDGSYALVVGSGGYVARFDGSSLARVPCPVSTELRAVAWHPAQEHALVCGRDGVVLRYSHANSSLEALDTGLVVPVNYTGVSWRPDGGCALLVGDAGRIVKYDGSGFQLQQASGVNYLDVAWKPDGAYALIGGVSGNLIKYEERHLPPPLDFCVTKLSGAGTPATAFFSISWFPDPSVTDALIAGTQGVVARLNETGIAQLPTDTTDALYGVAWMPGSDYALAAGIYGGLLLFVGHGFIHPPSGTDLSFLDVSFSPDGSLALLLGQSGAVATYSVARRSSPRAVISSPRAHSVFAPGEATYFDGANSTPSFGGLLSFEWVSNLSGPIGSGMRLTRVLPPGTHLITLYANDSGGSGSASVPITVLAPNRSPVPLIDSPAEGGVYNDTDEILFDASRSTDPDGDALSFAWSSSRDGPLGTDPSFTRALSVGFHRISLRISDGRGYNVTSLVNITVVPFNRPPVPLVSSPQDGASYTTRESVRFDASASRDDDGDPLSFFWVSDLSGYLGAAARFSRSLPEGSHCVTVWVDDSRGGNSSASVRITVVRANEPPTLSIDSPAEGAVLEGPVEFSGFAMDPEGGPLSVEVRLDEGEWRAASLGGSGGARSWSYTLDTLELANGAHVLSARAYDGELASETAFLNFTVHNEHWGFSLSISFPLNGTSVRGRVRVMGAASRTGSSILQVELRVDDGRWVLAAGTSSWEYFWDTARVKNGWHVITVRAFDGMDYSLEESVKLRVDNPPAEGAKLDLLIAAAAGVAALCAISSYYLLKRGRREEGRARRARARRGEEE
ncbi:MAG: Ig-like domain-containing protein [Thermoplasmatota archaeon]